MCVPRICVPDSEPLPGWSNQRLDHPGPGSDSEPLPGWSNQRLDHPSPGSDPEPLPGWSNQMACPVPSGPRKSPFATRSQRDNKPKDNAFVGAA